MDMNLLAHVLNVNITSDLQRKENEALLDKFKETKNFAPYLLNIACEGTNLYTKDVRLNAAIQLKNFVSSYWKFSVDHKTNQSLCFEDDKIIIIQQDDKNYVRDSIIPAITFMVQNKEGKVIKQLNQCVKKLIRYDFQKIWMNSFVTQLQTLFDSGEEPKILAGIILFHQLSKIYEFESGDYKVDYNKIFGVFNNYFLTFLDKLLTQGPEFIQNSEVVVYVYKIWKIFFKSIQLFPSEIIMDAENYEKWMKCLVVILQGKLSSEVEMASPKSSDDIEALDKHYSWKLKKICFHFINRVYSKYGSTKLLESDRSKPLSELIEKKYSAVYLKLTLETYFKYHTTPNSYLPDEILCFIYKFISQLIARSHLMEEIVPHISNIKEWLVKDCMIGTKDIEMLTHDPKAYIEKQFDIGDSYYMKRFSVCQLVKAIVKYKPKAKRKKKEGKKSEIVMTQFFEEYYKYLIDVIEMYEGQIQLGNNPDVRIKESVMFILQNISEVVGKYALGTIEKLIQMYILKEFDSKVSLLRERACTFVEQYGEFLKHSAPTLPEEITKKICNILEYETELPVKVMAAVATPILVKIGNVKLLLQGHVHKLLEIYLNLMHQIDLEEIIDGLETIISCFTYEIKVYAVTLAGELVKHFNKVIKTDLDNDDESGAGLMVADGILRSLLKLVQLFVNDEEIFPHLEILLFSVIKWGLSLDGFEKIDDVLDIIHEIVLKAKKISPNTWKFFPEVIYTITGTPQEIENFKKECPDSLYEGLGMDSLQEVTQIICLFISKDPETFINTSDMFNKPFVTLIMDLVKNIISNSKIRNEYANMKSAIKILIVMVEMFKWKIDPVVLELVKYIGMELENNKIKSSFKLNLLELLASCCIYNPELAMTALQTNNHFERTLSCWFDSIKKITVDSELKKTLMALTSLLTIDPMKQSKLLLENVNVILNQMINIAEKINERKLKEIERTNKAAICEAVNLSSDEEEDDEERDATLNTYLNNIVAKVQNKEDELIGDMDELIEDDGDDDYDEFECINNITPIDKQCEFLFMRDALLHISDKNNLYYNEIIGRLDTTQKEKLEQMIKNAETWQLNVK